MVTMPTPGPVTVSFRFVLVTGAAAEVEEVEAAAAPPPAFRFQSRHGDLDLRALSRVNVERVVRDGDVDALQAVLPMVTFSRVELEDVRRTTTSDKLSLQSLNRNVLKLKI